MKSLTPETSGIEPYIAVVGSGCWGKNLVRNFNELGVLKTICDGAGIVQEQMREAYPQATVVADIEEVLEDSAIQAVVIAAPAAQHFSLSERVLKADKHVFVEKPLSLTHKEGKILVELSDEKKKILFVGHILQYHPAIVRLKQIVNKGKIGRIQYIYSHRLSFGRIRREEDILWSFAPHDISVILSLIAEEPGFIDTIGSNFLHSRIADVTMTNLKFSSGISAHIFVSWLNPFKEQKLVVVGGNGMLVFDDTEPIERKLIHYPHTINWEYGSPVPQKAEGIAIDLDDIWEEPLKAECKAFLRAVETGVKPLTSGEEGLRVLGVLERSQQSMEQKEKNTVSASFTSVPSVNSGRDYFVHSTAVIDKDVVIGKDSNIWHFSHVLSGTTIGEECNIGQNVVIGPDVNIGNKCKVQNNVSVYAGVTLEDGVFCGPSMVFTNVYNPRAEIRKMNESRPTLVKRGATIGANATIVCGHKIGTYSFIGAGAVVTKDVPDYALMVGNPARKIGWVCRCGERLAASLLCRKCKRQYHLRNDKIKLVED